MKKLGIDWVLRQLPACLADAGSQLVDVLRCVDTDDDAEPDPAATWLWLRVGIGAELVNGKERQECASQFEDREVARVERL